ncbi:hypothetical protein P0Y43_05530 [Pseudomonas entomophila]|uniref:hypothetical protein n=1 Tax=Pseudomonas entomophila TaxID=312306 RepID=UPI0023D8250B|nr:hypothetical protein [Pseudomonas entomophila]MDF0730190.1 hypothetical protein [Pseudomonas entomophila]
MKRIRRSILLALCIGSTSSNATIHDTTGDIDIGISRDVLQATVACKQPEVMFKLMEYVANGRRDSGVAYLEERTKAGACITVKMQSVTVLAVKMAKISGTERKTPSIYVLVKVRGPNFVAYVGPSALNHRGFDIIKDAQLLNKKIGAPLVQ